MKGENPQLRIHPTESLDGTAWNEFRAGFALGWEPLSTRHPVIGDALRSPS
jgi:hypothetical protein